MPAAAPAPVADAPVDMASDVVSPDKHYAACLDSVAAIEAAKLKGDADAVARNVEHLELMIAKDIWGPAHDMSILSAAVASGKA